MSKDLTTTPAQLELNLTIQKEVEIDGIGMGVLSDGTPYLTARGLARMCGIDHTGILLLGQHWSDEYPQPRVARIKSILASDGIHRDRPYIEIDVLGTKHHAYTDVVCMAVLEYYAFETRQSDRSIALQNYRLLARKSFQDFIYNQVGYDPSGAIPVAWQQFHDRVTSAYAKVPSGYFSVFKEVADIIVTLIQHGADVGIHFVPDISIGGAWSKYWEANSFDFKYGKRRKYDHDYPSYFPQALSNPQSAFCYPDIALGQFRRWIRETYLVEKLPSYLAKKVKDGVLPVSFTEVARIAFQSPEEQP